MRDDLLDAQSTVDWAVAQIKVFESRFRAYSDRRPYEIVTEADPDGRSNLVVAYSLGEPDPILNAEVGAIINAIRSALDILASALAIRNGVTPSPKTHFPIRKHRADFVALAAKIKDEKWLSDFELAEIESLRPYQGGDWAIYTLHQLDILRKHERLLRIAPIPSSFRMRPHIKGMKMIGENLEGKTVLVRYPLGTDFIPTEDNADLSLAITFDEPSLGLREEPVIPALMSYAARVSEIISIFNR